ELRHARWLEHDLAELPGTRADPEHMIDEIEINLKAAAVPRDRRGRQPACRHVESDLPRMIEPGRQLQPDLADDLGPEVHRVACVFPRRIRQLGPTLRY